MTGHIHPGPHPNADSLSAFLEGVLSEHERAECLAHFAECPECREAVFLAQQPPPAPVAANPIRVWGRWFAPIPVLSGVLVASALVLGVWLYVHRSPAAPTQYAMVRNPAQPKLAAPAPTIRQPELKKSPAAARVKPEFRPPAQRETAAKSPSGSAKSGTADKLAQPLPAPTPSPPPMRPAESPTVLSGGALRLSIEHDQGTDSDLAQRAAGSIAGTVADKSGAVIPGAKVTVKNEANNSTIDGVTNGSGVFSFPAIPPGSYTATIAAPGLQTYELQHIVVTQGAAVGIPTIPLQVATTAEAIEIVAAGDVAMPIDSPQASQTLNQNMIRDLAIVGRDAAELMKIMPGTAMAGVPPPPPRTAVTTGPPPPTLTTVTIGKCKLTVDLSGALVLSRDAGRHWKAVKPLWQGKVARLAIANEQAAAAGLGFFQLTTESGSVWLSRDGTHWYSVPAQH